MSGEDVCSDKNPERSRSVASRTRHTLYIYMNQAGLSLLRLALAATALIMLPRLSLASEGSQERKPLPTEEALEKYDDPPAPLPMWGIGTSPGMVTQEGPFISRQVNVNGAGMNIVGDAANEPSIAVDPTDHSRMVIGWRQFNSVTSNFRQSGYGYTSNGGATWTFPGVLEPNVFRSDPVLVCDDMGRFLYLSLLQNFFDNVWRSINGGQTFTNLGPATGGDKQWFTIDNVPASTGHGFQYQCWSTAGNNYQGRQFSRSIDGGSTWMDPINIPHSPQWGTPDVDSNGNLFIGGVNVSTDQVWCIRSTNAKNGAITPTFDQSTAVNVGGFFVISDVINPEGLAGMLFLAVDRSGTATNNNIYIMASVQPTGASNGTDVMFVRSTDGGLTFSAPRRINDDPVNQNKWHWFGTLAVAPNGRIDSVWLDSRNAANNTDSQLFYSFSVDGGVTWSPNVAVSVAFNPFLGYPNQNKMGDYITIVSDNAGGDVAYAATFNSEEDVYYVRVTPDGAPTPSPSPTPTATATATATIPPSPTPTATATATFTPTATATATSTGTPVPSPSASASPSPTTTPTPSVSPSPAAQPLNLSTRMKVLTDDNAGIGGFIVTGSAPKNVLLRAIGPSLGVSSVLVDPVLELHGPAGFATITNDNWMDDPAQATLIEATGIPPTSDFESAIVATLNPGAYTAVVRGKNNTTGVGLVEAYDLNEAVASKLANISTRAMVGTANDIVIAGFILGHGTGNTRIAIRGIGPSLAAVGVPNALVNPTLELRDNNAALLQENNDWQDDPTQAAALTAAGLALTNQLESGMVLSLPPGTYTALLAGQNNGTGVGLVEVYDLGTP